MLNKIKFFEVLFKPFYQGLRFWPFTVKFIRHPIYKQAQFFYSKHFSHYYNFEKLILTKDNFEIYCQGNRGSVEMELLMSRDYEPEISKHILDNLKDTKYFLDIGANIGFYSLLVAKRRPEIKIISFEPVRETFDRLIKNIKKNNFTNITAHNIGLANENTRRDIFLTTELGHNSFLSNSNLVEKVLVKKTDDFLVLKDKKIFIKIDTEGYEFEVIKGMEELLKNNACQIVFEFTPKFYRKFYQDDHAPAKLLSFLEQRNFQITFLDFFGAENRGEQFMVWARNKN